MKSILFFLFFGFIFSAHANSTPPPLDSLILSGKERIYELKFKEAEQLFITAQKKFPMHPHGYVSQAYISSLKFGLDQSNDSLAQVLNQQIDKASDVAKAFKDLHPDEPDSYFYIAIASGIKALYHVINRSFIKGYFSGRSAKKNLEKVIKLDPTYNDAYLGLGMFHYYADLLPGFLKFFAGILGFKGDRVRGRNEVYLAASRGHAFKVEGEFIYHSIGYFLEGEKTTAIRAIQQLYRRYPTNQGFGLMIAYHYRRIGYPEKCIEYCQGFTDEFSNVVPQITNLRYYNMAVSYYDLNKFAKADSVLTLLDSLPTRKSMYYQAGIDFYRGHLADLRFEREKALSFFNKIKKAGQTKYWFYRSQMHRNVAMDSLQYRYYVANNFLGSRNFSQSLRETLAIKRDLDAGQKSVNPDLPFLVGDLLGLNYQYTGQWQKAQTVYDSFFNDLNNMQDEFHKCWIRIHFARALRSQNKLTTAKKIFESVESDDDYTTLIIEREIFITERMIKQRTQQTGE